jgi:hypothetical protein
MDHVEAEYRMVRVVEEVGSGVLEQRRLVVVDLLGGT